MFQIDVVAQCKANDRRAQMALYKQYCDGMFRVALRFLKNTDDAEDVLQESFIKAFQKIHQYKGEVTFGAWLKRIVVNKCIDFLKSKHQNHVELSEHHHIPMVGEENDWTVEDTITMDEVREEILRLPEKYSYVVLLFLLEGYDHSEISGILDISETSCRTRLLRGKGYLKESLKNRKNGARP